MLHGATYNLGFTGPIGHTEQLGEIQWFDDKNYWSTSGGSRASYSDSRCKAILVLNRAGTTVSPGQIVVWDIANEGPGKATGAVAGAGVTGAGVVDPTLTGTVADGEAYYLIVGGPTKLQFSGDATALAIGDRLISGFASGRTQSGTGVSSSGLIYANVADSTAHTNTITAADFDVSYTFPANTLKAGDVIRIKALVRATATNSTDTLTLLLTLGGVTVATTGAVDVANNDIGRFDFDVVVRTIGASGTIFGHGTVGLGVPGTVTAKNAVLTSTTLDTTAAAKVAVNADWSVADPGNSAVLSVLEVYVDRKGGSVYPVVGTALEAVSGGATAGTLYRARVNFEGTSAAY